MCMHTINFCKNCFSLLKYFFICPSTHSSRLLARFFFNNLHPPFPFRARSNKYLYPTPACSLFGPWSMKLKFCRRNAWLHDMLSTIRPKSMLGTSDLNVNSLMDSCNSQTNVWHIFQILFNSTPDR